MPLIHRLAFRLPLPCLLAALSLVATSAGAAAQVIASVSPPQGSLGSVLTIEGSGFGAGRPKVFLQFADAEGGKPKAFRMTVLSSSDTQLVVQVSKGQAGACTLQVLPQDGNGGDSAPFEMMLPQVGAVLPASAAPGDAVVIQGAFFGVKALKVSFFDRRASVLDQQDDSLTVIVPKGLPDGQWTPRVVNALGADWGDSALTISGSPTAAPADSVRATIGGARFVAKGEEVSASIIGPKVAFDAVPADSGKQLSVLMGFSMFGSPVPSVFSGAAASQPVFYLQVDSTLGSSSVWVAVPGSLPWEVAVVGRSGDQLAGVLDAVLMRLAGPGPDMLHVSDGWFLVTPQF